MKLHSKFKSTPYLYKRQIAENIEWCRIKYVSIDVNTIWMGSIYIECLIKCLNIYAIVCDANSRFHYYYFAIVFSSFVVHGFSSGSTWISHTWNDSIQSETELIRFLFLLLLQTSTASTFVKHILYLNRFSMKRKNNGRKMLLIVRIKSISALANGNENDEENKRKWICKK